MRNVLGYRDADHEETSPQAARLAVTALSCSLVGQSHEVRLVEGSRAYSIYAKATTTEDYYCSYGVNPEFVPLLEGSGLFVSGTDESGDVRVLERQDHPFFFGTLFIPQTRSNKEHRHPLLAAFVHAARPRKS